MKRKEGKTLRLRKGDVRVGNFIYHAEGDHYKMTDLNGVFSVRVSAYTSVGMMMKAAMASPQENETFLHNYAAVMYNALSAVPDMDFLAAVNSAAVAAVDRHREMYGMKDGLTPEEDAAITEEERELDEAVTQARREILGHE